MKASHVLRKLDEQVGTLSSPTYEFIGDNSVKFRFNTNTAEARIMQELNRLQSFHVSPLVINNETDDTNERALSITVTWKPLTEPSSTAILNDMRFLITKFKMSPV